MEKYVINIKDLVSQTLANGSEIKEKAMGGDALSCFQMGMIHMFGIDTPIDFKEASKYFSYQSLGDDPDAKMLLGYIFECEGDYSEAFKRYANAADIKGSDKKDYITKVYEERNNLTDYFKKIGIPDDVLNKEISQILNEYIGGGHFKIDACIKLATICNDEPLCLEVAQNYISIRDYYSAKKWLLKGNIDCSNHLYIYVKERLIEVEDAIKTSRDLEVIDINGDSLVEIQKISSISGIDNLNNININTCKQDWQASVSQVVESIKRVLEEEERIRLQRIQEEEAARLKRLQEEEEERQRKKIEELDFQKRHKEELRCNEIQNDTVSDHQHELGGQIIKAWADNNSMVEIPDNLIQLLGPPENIYSALTICYHCHIIVRGGNGQVCRLLLNVKSLNGNSIIEKTVEKKPNSDVCEWKDFQIVTYNSEYRLKSDGIYNYEVSLSLCDNMKNVLDTTSFQITLDFTHHVFKDDESIVV